MILIEPDKNNKRRWKIYNKIGDEKLLLKDLNFISASSLIKKFGIVANLYKEMSTIVPGFKEWFVGFLHDYKEGGYNAEFLLKNSDKFVTFSEDYVNIMNIDFTKFVDRSKSSKTSIFFDENDIRNLAIVSTSLKLYLMFRHDEQFVTPENIHKAIYNLFMEKCKEGTIDKIFELIKSKTCRSSLTDRYIWDIIKMSIIETPETYTMVVFNFLMNNLISTIDIRENPIKYLSSIVEDKIRWLMCGIYKDNIIYGSDDYSNTEDIQGSSQTKESFYLIACNDLISKVAKIGMEILFEEYNVNEDNFEKVRSRLDNVKFIDPPMKLLVLPIASKVLRIPYKFLLTAQPKHVVLIGVLLHHLSKDILDSRFPVLMDFLIGCPRKNSSVVVKSSYKIKNVEYIIDDPSRIFTFNSTILKDNIISPICGVLSATKKNTISITNGTSLKNITYNEIESDIISFYTELFSDQLDESFNEMRKKLDLYFQY